MKHGRRVKVPGYEVEDVLGTGAMATVYRAVQTTLQRQIALKVLHDGVARDADYRERFLREARAAAKLSHGNIVRAYEAGVHEGTYWFAMELVEGEDLDDRLQWAHTLTEQEALDIAVQVARALAAAEEHGLIHRDVKPENVLLGNDGSVKLADLGLAKVQGDGSITADGMTVGTVAFLSPEQCRGAADLDIRSDLWALGGLIYTMLTGELPFGRGENAVVTMKRIVQDDPPSLDAKVKVSPATLALVNRLMRRHRDERPRSATETVRLLEDARARIGEPAAEDTSSSRRGGGKRRRRGSTGALAGAGGSAPGTAMLVPLVMAVGVGFGVVVALGNRSPKVETLAAVPSASPTPRPAPAAPQPPPLVVPAAKPAPVAGPVAPPARPAPPMDLPVPPPSVSAPARPREEEWAVEPERRPVERVPASSDLGRVRKAAGATTAETLDDGRVRLQWAFDEDANLAGWKATGDGEAKISGGALLLAARARGTMDLELLVPLQPPIEVRYRVRVTTPAFGRRGILWTTFGPRLASFSGAALYEIGAGEPTHLAGSKAPQSVIGGTRRAVCLTLEPGLTTGSVDGKERYRHEVDVSGPLRLAFHLEGGVGIDVRDLVIEGGVPDEPGREEER